jgi:hypothetical protein
MEDGRRIWSLDIKGIIELLEPSISDASACNHDVDT